MTSRSTLSILGFVLAATALVATSPTGDTDRPVPTYHPNVAGPDVVLEAGEVAAFDLTFVAVGARRDPDAGGSSIDFRVEATGQGLDGPADLMVALDRCDQPGDGVAWSVPASPEATTEYFEVRVDATPCAAGQECETHACVTFEAVSGASSVAWRLDATGGVSYSEDATLLVERR